MQQSGKFCRNHKNWFMTELKPAMEPTKHESVYIEQSIKQLGEHQIAMESYRQGIDQRIESFEDDIRSHLWVTDDFVEPASKGLGKNRADVEKLLDRLAEVVKGFEALPREEEALLREEEQTLRNDEGRTEE